MGQLSDLWTLLRANKKLVWLPILMIALLFVALLVINPPRPTPFNFTVF